MQTPSGYDSSSATSVVPADGRRGSELERRHCGLLTGCVRCARGRAPVATSEMLPRYVCTVGREVSNGCEAPAVVPRLRSRYSADDRAAEERGDAR